MVEDNQKRLNRMHVLLGILVTVVTYTLIWFIVINRKVLPLNKGALKSRIYFMALVSTMPIYLILYAGPRLYVPKQIQRQCSELASICKANITGLMLFTLMLFGLRGFVSRSSYSSTKIILAFFAANIIPPGTEQVSMCTFLRSLWTNGRSQKHVFLIGRSRTAGGFVDRVSVNPEWGHYVQGILSDHQPAGLACKKVQVLRPTNHLRDLLASNTLDEVAITLSTKEYSDLEQIVTTCGKSGVYTKFIPDYNNIILTIPYMEDLQRLPVIHIRHVPLTGMFNATMEWIVDFADTLFGLIAFSPLMLVTVLLIRVTSPGPILFSQEGVELHSHLFKMYKFRSMEIQDPGREHNQWTTPRDPGTTSVGRFVRKTSIGETPQFFNVLIGNVSLVGSRLERPLLVKKFKEEIPRHMIKYQVRPGLTGWAQVSGCRGSTSTTRRIGHDPCYIENQSLDFDFKVMFPTIFKGLISKNTY